jgi:FG-GAP-like repeat/Secretion system C-terminal sorting domain
LLDTNWLNIPALQLKSIYPAFGDLDGDGDTDMLLGTEDGYIKVFTNSAGPNAPFQLTPTASYLQNSTNFVLDVGQNATPQLIDANNDGLLDLMIGEKNGGINYYQNIGTATQPSFVLINDTVGNVVATNYLGINGYSTPHFYHNQAGQLELLLGTETGVINYYNQIEWNLTGGSFNLIDSAFANIREGDRSALCLGDLDGDGLTEMIYGQNGGGLAYFKGIPLGTAEVHAPALAVYPNPADNEIRFSSPAPAVYTVYDIAGRALLRGRVNGGACTIERNGLPSGMYVLVVQNERTRLTARVIFR